MILDDFILIRICLDLYEEVNLLKKSVKGYKLLSNKQIRVQLHSPQFFDWYSQVTATLSGWVLLVYKYQILMQSRVVNWGYFRENISFHLVSPQNWKQWEIIHIGINWISVIYPSLEEILSHSPTSIFNPAIYWRCLPKRLVGSSMLYLHHSIATHQNWPNID